MSTALRLARAGTASLLVSLFAACSSLPSMPSIPGLGGGSSAEASTGSYGKKQLQDLYSGFVRAEGFQPEITPSGNVKFTRNSRIHILYVDEKDPTYFRLAMAFAESDKSAAARARRLEGASFASGEVKVGKAYLDSDGDPTISVELFAKSPEEAKPLLARMLKVLDLTYTKYQEGARNR
ncbi:hypothetical protein [Ideonella livida]|uniref:Uncharacterized protein n=1 Tax=Ideonella livida TaxID=2707176 RepID=A0A7C9TLT3_9BURK|nr:hypothetical protein [Ideonella livida]NDY93398.1 hypothetical protein [Ideonella livida]